jgi:hypothetical protein
MPAVRLTNVRWDHEAIIDYMIANPDQTQNMIAQSFGYTASRLSIIINSPAFKARYKERQAVLSDPLIMASIEERLETLANRSLEKLLDRLDQNQPVSNADLIRMASLGAGDRNKREEKPQLQQNLYVVNLPAPAPDAKTWLNSAQGVKEIIEVQNAG